MPPAREEDGVDEGPGRAPRRVGAAIRRRTNWVVIPANRAVSRWHAVEPPIWLVGDARSGTTWATNVINHAHDYRYMFEPFHPDFVPDAAGLSRYRYLRPSAPHPAEHDFAAKVFSGRLQHRRVDKLNRSILFRGLVIKDIFSHLTLGWVDTWFPEVRKVLLLRHPFAVALSKMDRPTWRWVRDPEDLLRQPDLVADHLGPYVDTLRGAESEFERLVAIWGAIHRVPLRQLSDGRLLLVFYEELLDNPHAVLDEIRAYLGEGPATNIRNLSDVLERASETSGQASGTRREHRVDAWRDRLTDAQVSRGVELLDALGLAGVYNDSPMPDRAAAEALRPR